MKDACLFSLPLYTCHTAVRVAPTMLSMGQLLDCVVCRLQKKNMQSITLIFMFFKSAINRTRFQNRQDKPVARSARYWLPTLGTPVGGPIIVDARSPISRIYGSACGRYTLAGDIPAANSACLRFHCRLYYARADSHQSLSVFSASRRGPSTADTAHFLLQHSPWIALPWPTSCLKVGDHRR